MAPSEHLDWFENNVEWFESIPITSYAGPVPACPGWNVAYVLGHLALGLGYGYPLGVAEPPDSVDPFVDATWPDPPSTEIEVADAFAAHMNSCAALFRSTDPTLPCWTYAGPGVAGFWFRRAAIETTLHRMDVAEALEIDDPPLSPERGHEAVADAVDFALPFAASITQTIPAAISIVNGPDLLQLGGGEPVATVDGPPNELLAALWGRTSSAITIEGDSSTAAQWMHLAEAAFSGR